MDRRRVNLSSMRLSAQSWLLLMTAALSPVTSSRAQTGPSTPCPATGRSAASSSKPCASAQTPASPPAQPSAAQQFPYPGSDAAPTARDQPTVPNAPSSSKGDPQEVMAPASPKNAFPYPGDPEATGSSSSNSSGSSSSSSTNPDLTPVLDDAGSEGTTTRRKLPKVTRLQNDEDRAYEDLTVARFYRDKGDLNAAYLRSKDATTVQPQLPDAHFVLAEIAEKLKKRDEAVAEFTTYLKLEPDGDSSKAAQKALDRLK